MRINRYLALCGLGSRRSVEPLIRSGQIVVNGESCTDLSREILPGDQVSFQNKPVMAPKNYSVVMFHKPPGCVCTHHDPQQRQTIYDYLPPALKHLRYVGRLDLQSRGLLLLTDDGELCHRLTHPSWQIPRTYRVWSHPPLSPAHRKQLLSGVLIGEQETAKAKKIKVFPQNTEITLTEGKNREIRRMLEVLGYEVRDLKRISWATQELGGLAEGDYRDLTPEEAGKLYGLVKLE